LNKLKVIKGESEMKINIDYVSKEDFEIQPREIQNILKDYFEGAFGLYQDTTETIQYGYLTKDRVRFLTEGQLRSYIQNSFAGDVKIELEWSNDGYIVNVVSSINDEKVYEQYYSLESEPIKAYWYAVLEIIKEGI
jgi:hypothetical protein